MTLGSHLLRSLLPSSSFLAPIFSQCGQQFSRILHFSLYANAFYSIIFLFLYAKSLTLLAPPPSVFGSALILFLTAQVPYASITMYTHTYTQYHRPIYNLLSSILLYLLSLLLRKVCFPISVLPELVLVDSLSRRGSFYTYHVLWNFDAFVALSQIVQLKLWLSKVTFCLNINDLVVHNFLTSSGLFFHVGTDPKFLLILNYDT